MVHPRESDLLLATHVRGIWIIDDISPLRALTPELMSQEAALIANKPAYQYLETSGGWPEGDETFVGPSRPDAPQITYYQKGRHIFGDLKIDILDQNGKLVDTVAGGKRRGLNRASWSMHIKAPAVPPAATALFGASQGPRVLPGTYTVKMTKADHVYTEQLNVVLDPRAKFSVEDRKAQFDQVMKIYKMLEHMTWSVEAIEGVRDAAKQRAAKLPPNDPLRSQLQQLTGKCDELRSRIVATKEGGAITGEERIREHLGRLYGEVNGYEGRPTDYQATRADSLSHELEDVINDFQKLTEKELSGVNAALKKKKMEAIPVLSEADWQKKRAAEAGAASPGTQAAPREVREVD